MASYDPDIIRRMADRLYARARSIIFFWIVAGVAAGGTGGVIARDAIVQRLGNPTEGGAAWLVVGAAVLICGFLGFAYGREKAFHLKVEAQRLLCQVQIEANTR